MEVLAVVVTQDQRSECAKLDHTEKEGVTPRVQ
jgi:hypothetical protein